jgi:hypothetical protein
MRAHATIRHFRIGVGVGPIAPAWRAGTAQEWAEVKQKLRRAEIAARRMICKNLRKIPENRVF